MYELSDRKLTYDDYASIDDGNRYELINGELIMAPAPAFEHQDSASRIGFLLQLFINTGNLGKLVYAPVDVILGELNTVQPDIVYISNENKKIIDKRGVLGAPDLVVEIISPSSMTFDRITKKELYERFGVKEFWLADYNNKTIEVYELVNGKYELFSFAAEEGIVKSKVLENFELDLSKVFQTM